MLSSASVLLYVLFNAAYQRSCISVGHSVKLRYFIGLLSVVGIVIVSALGGNHSSFQLFSLASFKLAKVQLFLDTRSYGSQPL